MGCAADIAWPGPRQKSRCLISSMPSKATSRCLIARRFGIVVPCLATTRPYRATTGVCAIHAAMLRAEQAMRNSLAQETLGSIAKQVDRKAPKASRRNPRLAERKIYRPRPQSSAEASRRPVTDSWHIVVTDPKTYLRYPAGQPESLSPARETGVAVMPGNQGEPT